MRSKGKMTAFWPASALTGISVRANTKATIRLAINAFPLEHMAHVLDFLQSYCVMRLRVPNTHGIARGLSSRRPPAQVTSPRVEAADLDNHPPGYPFTATK